MIKNHTSLGYDELKKAIANGAPIEENVAIVALEHHEKFKGGGYPMGKTGRLEEKDNGIHEYARIVTIADVYSALLMKRVYKEAVSHQEALAIIREGAGSQFDPAVIEAFLARESDFARVACMLPDEERNDRYVAPVLPPAVPAIA